jgi:diaminopropionate ammonia-lyase
VSRYSFNPWYKEEPDWSGEDFAFLSRDDMLPFHRSLPGYAPTPLVSLPGLAARLGVKEILVKDEARRFGIKAFKALGASYAIYSFLKKEWASRFGTPFTPELFQDKKAMEKLGAFTFCAATDGNHGKAVAWTAGRLGQKAVIYMPDDTAQARIDAVTMEGATVELAGRTFDDCVERCTRDAKANGWQEIADTRLPGYMDIPARSCRVFQHLPGTVRFPFNGAGGAAVDVVSCPQAWRARLRGVSYYTRRYGKKRPRLVCVEPAESDCFLESVLNGGGEPLFTKGNHLSIMAGLNCGMPSLIAWQIMKDACDLFLAVPDDYVAPAMRVYYEEGVTSGESGAAALAGLLALTGEPGLEEAVTRLGLCSNSRILLINSEGDTDRSTTRPWSGCDRGDTMSLYLKNAR